MDITPPVDGSAERSMGVGMAPSIESSQNSLSTASTNHGNVYIRGLPTTFDEARLLQFFSAFGEVDSTRISYPAAGSRAGVTHAFVRFKEPSAATNAINTLQGTMLDGVPVVIKLADADMAPRIQSGLCTSEWAYVRGLPGHLSRDDVATLFCVYGQLKDLKHFPSTEFYRGSGALIQFETHEQSGAAINALNGCVLPGASQPLLVRFADSPAEKAAKAARKERLSQRNGFSNMTSPLGLQEQLQQQLLELSLKAAGPASMVSNPLSPSAAAAAMAAMAGAPLDTNSAAWLGAGGPTHAAAAAAARPHAGQGCSIYIKGMPEDADKLWLYEKFARFGGILSVRVLLDEATGRCNGIGFVNYTDPEGARLAHETMNGISMGERLLHVMIQNHANGGRVQPVSRPSPGIVNGMGLGAMGMMPNGVPGSAPFISGGVPGMLHHSNGEYSTESGDYAGSW